MMLAIFNCMQSLKALRKPPASDLKHLLEIVSVRMVLPGWHFKHRAGSYSCGSLPMVDGIT